LTPFSECGSAILLEDIVAVEVVVVVEVVVDRGMSEAVQQGKCAKPRVIPTA
jgi:hypothetical protein